MLALPLVPAGELGRFHPYDAARALQGFLLLCAVLWRFWQPISPSQDTRLWALLLFFGVMSCAMAEVPRVAWRDGIWTAAWLLSIAPLAITLQSPRLREKVLGAVVAGQFIYALLATTLLLYGLLAEQLIAPWHAFPGYENPRYFNHTQTLSIPLLLAYSLWPQAARPLRRLAAATVVLHVFLISLFLARATIVSVAAVAVLVSVGLRESRLLKALLLYAALGALLYFLGLKVLPDLLGIPEAPPFRDPGERGSIEARLYLWQIALHAIREHPWLGLGPMHFAHTLNGEAAHPHNIYLQIAAEYGLPFAILAIGLILRWIYRTFLELREGASTSDAVLKLGCFVSITSAMVDGMFSGDFVMPLSQTWLCFSVALLMSLQRSPVEQIDSPPSASWKRWHWRVLHAAVTCGLILILTAMVQELAQPDVNLVGGASLSPRRDNPRFWLDGWF